MSIQKVDKTTGDTSLICGSTNFSDNPIGAILPYGGATAPSGWILCQGQELLKTDYAELYAVIGDAFGTASVNTKFVLPNLQGEFLRGAGTNSHSGQGDGGAVGEHQDATQVPTTYSTEGQYQFGILNNVGSGYANADKMIATNTYKQFTSAVATASGYGTITTRPTNTSVNYIIKAKMIAVPADFMSAVDEAVEEKLTVETITGTGTTGLGFTAKKSGNVVTVYLYCTADVSDGQSISFGVLPTGYRPPKNVKFLIHSNNGSLDPTQGMFVDISSYNGGIASYSYVALTSGQCGAITYIVD